MAQKVYYTDEKGNKININSLDGFNIIVNSLMDICNGEDECYCVKENIKGLTQNAFYNKVYELNNN